MVDIFLRDFSSVEDYQELTFITLICFLFISSITFLIIFLELFLANVRIPQIVIDLFALFFYCYLDLCLILSHHSSDVFHLLPKVFIRLFLSSNHFLTSILS